MFDLVHQPLDRRTGLKAFDFLTRVERDPVGLLLDPLRLRRQRGAIIGPACLPLDDEFGNTSGDVARQACLLDDNGQQQSIGPL